MTFGLGREICTMSLEYLVVPERKELFKKKKSESIWNDTGASLEILPMPKIQTIEQ